MPCPTCSETMRTLYASESGRSAIRWCPRCGTLCHEVLGRLGEVALDRSEAPKLVERCREFEQRLPLVTAGDGRPWRTLGIHEAINTPENRAQ